MKKRKIILNALLLVLLISVSSCTKDDDAITPEIVNQTPELKEVVGEWQMYRDENLESVIDEWTGTEWTYVDKWFSNTREDSVIIIDFKEDGTFDNRYADVVSSQGNWEAIEEGKYNITLIVDNEEEESAIITFYCDNTFSVSAEGDDTAIFYYKKIDQTECDNLINYKVVD